MENSIEMVEFPWRKERPELPNNKEVAERILDSLKIRLIKDPKPLEKYKTVVEDYSRRDMRKGSQKKNWNERIDRCGTFHTIR